MANPNKEFYFLLEDAKDLRNAMSHRHRLDLHSTTYSKFIRRYITNAVKLLKLLGDDKAAVELSIAGHYFFAGRTRAENKYLDSFNQPVYWMEYEERARRCESRWSRCRSKPGRHLEIIYGDAAWRFRRKSLLTLQDRAIFEMTDSPWSYSWIHDWWWDWKLEMMETQELIDEEMRDYSSEDNNSTPDGGSFGQESDSSVTQPTTKRSSFRSLLSSLKTSSRRFYGRLRGSQHGEREDQEREDQEREDQEREDQEREDRKQRDQPKDGWWAEELDVSHAESASDPGEESGLLNTTAERDPEEETKAPGSSLEPRVSPIHLLGGCRWWTRSGLSRSVMTSRFS